MVTMLSALHSNLLIIKEKEPNTRVGLITFNSDVVVIGDA
jgi:hypothetical protein